MGLIRHACVPLMIVAFHSPGVAADAAQGAWPASTACTSCTTLQFGPLEMQLPNTVLGRVLVVGRESHFVHLVSPNPATPNVGAMLMSASRESYIGKYGKLGLPGAASLKPQDFFDLLGSSAVPDSPTAQVRRIEGIEKAKEFVAYRKGNLRAYWIQSAAGGIDNLHLIVDEDTIYSIVGTISTQMRDAVLSNLRLLPEP